MDNPPLGEPLGFVSPPPLVISPSAAADRLGVTVPDLVAWIRRHRYPFTEIKANGKPGDRGRNRWGLTDAQLVVILRGQARQFEEPKAEAEPEGPRLSAVSPDGKSRLPKRRENGLKL